MGRYVFVAIMLALVSVRGLEMLQSADNLEPKENTELTRSSERSPSNINRVNPKSRNASYNPLAGRTVRAKRAGNGHFYFRTKMNDVPVKVMVDTGATGVAINRSTARRLGIRLSNADFKYKSQTANGIAHFAAVMIDEVQIGRVIVTNVRAAVLKDSSLKNTLLGMSFLRKLRKFEINRDTLILTQ